MEETAGDMSEKRQNQKSRAVSGQDKRHGKGLELKGEAGDQKAHAKQKTTGRGTNSTNSFVIEGQELNPKDGGQHSSIFQQENQHRRVMTAPFQPKGKRGQKGDDMQNSFAVKNNLFKSSFEDAGPPTFQAMNPFGDKYQSQISSQYVEGDLLKATNIYQ